MTTISLFTPIDYARSRSLQEATLSTLSHYFYLGGIKATVIKNNEVQLEKKKLSCYTIALKIASYVLLLPITVILLTANLILRSQYRFTVITSNPESEIPSDSWSVREKDILNRAKNSLIRSKEERERKQNEIKSLLPSTLLCCCESGDIKAVKEILENPLLDLDQVVINPLIVAINSNHLEIVKILLAHPKIDLSKDIDKALFLAEEKGNAAILELLLQNQRANDKTNLSKEKEQSNKSSYSKEIASLNLSLACRRGDVELVKTLLKEVDTKNDLEQKLIIACCKGKIDPNGNLEQNLIRACLRGNIELVKILLKKVDRNDDLDKKLFCTAGEDIAMIKMLLKKLKIDPSMEDNKAIILAVKKGDLELVKTLLAYPSVNPAANHQETIYRAYSNQHLDILDLLLQDDRINPFREDNWLFSEALYKKDGVMIEKLLKHPKINLSSKNNSLLDTAICYENNAAIKAILQDPKIDPSLNDNQPLILAVRYKNKEIVELLLKDKRVDPTARNKQALKNAKGDSAMIELLKAKIEK